MLLCCGRPQTHWSTCYYYVGASSGIGAATAVAFARRGAGVAMIGRNKERLEQTAKECQDAGLKPEQVKKMLYITICTLQSSINT